MTGKYSGPNPNMNPLLKALRERRKALGLTQLQVAQRLGVCKSNVTQMEQGYSNPGLDRFCAYAKALECTVEVVPFAKPTPARRSLREIFGQGEGADVA